MASMTVVPDSPSFSNSVPIDIDELEQNADKTVVKNLFAEFEDDGALDDVPRKTYDELMAEGRKKGSLSVVTRPTQQHQVLPTSSPTRPDFASGTTSTKTAGKDGEKKERKKPVRLSEAILVGEKGFPALIKDMESFKPKGKGHEEQDLNRLLTRYQFWTQRMYPKSQFRDTVDRVEKICRSRLMHSHMTSWRDEKMGVNKPEDDDPKDADDTTKDASEPDEDLANEGNDSEAANVATSSPTPASRPPTSPLASSPGAGDDLDEDWFKDIEQVATTGAPGPSRGVSDMDEMDNMEMEMGGDDYDEDWQANLGHIPDDRDEPMPPPTHKPVPDQAPPSGGKVAPASSARVGDGDEEDYDMMFEDYPDDFLEALDKPATATPQNEDDIYAED